MICESELDVSPDIENHSLQILFIYVFYGIPFCRTLVNIHVRLFRHPEEIRSLLSTGAEGIRLTFLNSQHEAFPCCPKHGLALVVGRVTQALSSFHQLNEFNIQRKRKEWVTKCKGVFPSLPSFSIPLSILFSFLLFSVLIPLTWSFRFSSS